jgi:hypothetical protein
MNGGVKDLMVEVLLLCFSSSKVGLEGDNKLRKKGGNNEES